MRIFLVAVSGAVASSGFAATVGKAAVAARLARWDACVGCAL